MKPMMYIVTGANGHLGNTIIRLLKREGKSIRGLILPGEKGRYRGSVTYYTGDVTDKKSLEPLFRGIRGYHTILIHTAGLVDISDEVSDRLYQVNVQGTQNVVDLCKKYHVSRLVYVSSVHAIPEKDKLQVQKEIDRFSADTVTGGYAKTKAQATQIVLDAAAEGLNAVVVQPSGILGPYDESGNHLVQMVTDYIQGKLPAGVKGGYDFVDVRDVAAGTLAAAYKGKPGECYILSNRHYDVKEVLNMVKEVNGGRRIPILPMWMARAGTPFLEWYAKRRKQRPLYTRYSLYTLKSNDRFSHDKATRDLNYRPRDMYETIQDTVKWMKRKKKQKKTKDGNSTNGKVSASSV
ncbi:NAD-dependent epimerase/dehydratase family protein [Anaerolentibacter hominis]|uniref:NAD-dependent epimerase/dehydratase family protein n=1 Tax=Anaerolentibacter hominis TaxID=3079009 RepID=UPI0031B84856